MLEQLKDKRELDLVREKLRDFYERSIDDWREYQKRKE